MRKTTSGFTIVELLIVIVVIAILAAITIVAYNGIQNRAYDNSVKSDLTSFAKIMSMQKIDGTSERYPTTLTASMGFKFSKGAYGIDDQARTARYCYNSTTDTYVLLSKSKSGNYFKVLNGVISSNSATYGYGVCDLVGFTNTNPTQDGYWSGGSPQWSTWTN